MYSPFIFVKNNGYFGVVVLTLVMTSLLPRFPDVSMVRCFSVLILLCQQVTHKKRFAKKNMFDYCYWRSYDVKTSISSKRNSVTKFNDRIKGLYLNKIIVFGVFLSQRSPWMMPSTKRK